MRLDSLSDSEVDEYLKVVLADCQIDSCIRYGSAAAKKRDKNRFDFKFERRKIEVLSDEGLVLQPISDDRGTVEQIHLDLR